SGQVTVTISPATTLSIQSAPTGPVQVGSIVTVVLTETNTGNVDLTNVSVSGGGACASFSPASVPTLAKGTSQNFTCTFTAALPSPMNWSADGHGTDPRGNAAPAINEHQSGSVTVVSPPGTIVIKKVTSPNTN